MLKYQQYNPCLVYTLPSVARGESFPCSYYWQNTYGREEKSKKALFSKLIHNPSLINKSILNYPISIKFYDRYLYCLNQSVDMRTSEVWHLFTQKSKKFYRQNFF